MSFIKKIKTILFPTRTVLRSVEKKVEVLQKGVAELVMLTRKNEIRSCATFKNHLDKMGSREPAPEAELSYSFRFTASELQPQIVNHEPSKIILAALVFGDDYREKVAACLTSQKEYCEKQGYAHADLKLPPSRLLRHPSWYKIPLLYRLIQLGYRRIGFVDGDALITNPAIKVEGFFEQLAASGKDLMLANDEAGLNMGVLFVQDSPSLLRLLDLIWMFNFDEDNANWEQYAVRTLIDDFSFLGERLLVAPEAKSFNCFPKERAQIHKLNSQKNTWTRGDFLCHFSGIRSPLLEELIAAYKKDAD